MFNDGYLMSSNQEKLNTGDALIVTKKQILWSIAPLILTLIGVIVSLATWKANVDYKNEKQDEKIAQTEQLVSNQQKVISDMHDIMIRLNLGQTLMLKKLHIDLPEK